MGAVVNIRQTDNPNGTDKAEYCPHQHHDGNTQFNQIDFAQRQHPSQEILPER